MGEFGRLTPSVDQMFSQVERRPFTEFAPDAVIAQRTDVPLSLSGVAQDIGFPMMQQFGVAAGIPNGNFYEGPEDGDDSVIDDVENKLPGWSFATSTAEIYAQWNSGTNPTVQFIATADVAIDDYAYIETVVPVTQIGRIVRPAAILSSASYKAYMETQFLDITGATIDSPKTSYLTSAGVLDQWRTPRWGTEAYIRIRIGLKVSFLFGTGPIVLAEFDAAWLSPPAMYDSTFAAERSAFDPSASTTYGFRTSEAVSFNVAQYVAMGDGFVMGFSGLTDAAISAGKGQVRVKNLTQSTDIYVGNDVAGSYFSSTTDKVRGERLLEIAPNDTSPYDFLAGDALQVQMVTNSSWNSGSGDWHFHVRLLQAFGEAGSAWTIAA